MAAAREAATAEWKVLCSVDDIPRLGARVVTRASGGDIALFRTAGDAVFALLDRCPHKGGPLSQGIVFGERVACPLHNWTIGLADGCALAPDAGCVQRFAVRVEGRAVALDLAELRAPAADADPASTHRGGNDADRADVSPTERAPA